MWNRGVLPTAETKIVDGREDVSLGFLLWNEPDWRQLTANGDVLKYLALVSARVRLPDHSWEFGFRFVTSSALGGGATHNDCGTHHYKILIRIGRISAYNLQEVQASNIGLPARDERR